MMKVRCSWCGDDPLYIQYHDSEWGVPVYADRVLFEYLLLETFQAGLSWITILRKRQNFAQAFDQFDYQKIALYDAKKYDELIENKGIIRNKLKIKSATGNANAFIKIQKEFGSFSTYIWSFSNNKPLNNNWAATDELPASTALSEKISKDLKKRGFKFVGATVVYAFMQAIGMVNDHMNKCFRHKEIEAQHHQM
ncbi:DNA-3-methyladenine glycosylase I [Lutimonas zeaxanthinifaciens]|uniref:DNA-3-methyladenine glycosylase I n=1 Tax=Lutimonas zeaxanthinifaciens TaxID=3060215 RepID=UPI00265CF1E8|nr:DNA-3-methyladenine glycosylase I [Lutimonas sp. YSD2104]WKK65473.1 DNA-3-methyladenine glycosylase I [Lutimonas sp. YSD2104]